MLRFRTTLTILVLVCCLLVLSVSAQANTVHVRFAHFAVDAPTVGIQLNGGPSGLPELSFSNVSQWAQIPSGTYTLSVVAAGEPVIAPALFTFSPDTWLTLAVVGTVANDSLMVQSIFEDFTNPVGDDATRLVAFHAIEGAPAVDILGNSNLLVPGLAYPGTIAANDGTFAVDIPSGLYDVQIVVADDESSVVASTAAAVNGDTHLLMAAIGSLDNPQILAHVSDGADSIALDIAPQAGGEILIAEPPKTEVAEVTEEPTTESPPPDATEEVVIETEAPPAEATEAVTEAPEVTAEATEAPEATAEATAEPASSSGGLFTIPTFKVTIENIARQVVPQLFSPGIFVIHTEVSPFFVLGTVDFGSGLEQLAEDGDPSILSTGLRTTDLATVGVFDTPVGAEAPGPLEPGQSYEFTFQAVPGDFLNFVSMYVQSNDIIVAPNELGIALFDDEDDPITGDVTSQLFLVDVGTEINEAPGFGPNQAPRQPAPGSGISENGLVTILGAIPDGFNYPSVSQLLRVTVELVEE